ncbi:MAG: hypothetical protein GC186_03445 [Rhodobacteraceae bacterium]|nr:hypothetical protein [Paracoccaceae bacterium]
MTQPKPRRPALPKGAFALALICSVGAVTPGYADSVPGPQDLQALTYYLDHNDSAAAQAELRRLRAAFPDWQVPSDLSTLKQSQPTTEVDDIYRLIARHDLTGAQAALAKTQQKYPSWTPPDDLTRLLATAEAQQAFDKAVTDGAAQTAIAIAHNNQPLLQCDRVNNAWELADMYKSVNDSGAAVQTYRAVVGACTDIAQITATLQKADSVATPAQMTDLFDLARKRFAGDAPGLTTLQGQLAAGHGGTAVAATPPKATTPAAKVATAAPPVAPAPATAPVAAMPRPATPRQAIAAHGDGRLVQVRAAAKQGDWASCIYLSNGPRSLDILYERGWCAFNLDRPMEALAAFRQADRGGLGGTIQRDARFGMALSFLKMNMTEEAARIAAVTELTLDQRTQVESTILDQRGTRAYNLGEYPQAIAYFNGLEKLSGLRRDLAILRAYAYLNSGNRLEAYRQFTTLNDQLVTPETRAGLRASSGD